MTDIFVVPEPLLEAVGTVPFEPRQVQVVKYGDHARAMGKLEARVDRAYTQRNNAAVALVRMALLLGWPAGRGLDDLTDNAPEWRHVVYLDLPNGEQVSYHMAPADVHLLDGLPGYAGKWDGKFTGATAWADMVPAPDAAWRALLERETDHAAQVMEEGDFDPEELGDPDSEPLRIEVPPPVSWDTDGFFGAKPIFPAGVCACPKCEQAREVGKLFCAPHRYGSIAYLTTEQLAYMMQREGEQQ